MKTWVVAKIGLGDVQPDNPHVPCTVQQKTNPICPKKEGIGFKARN